ncbi:MAG: endo-1,4-beta-xylanase, partial [Lentisphaeria bacterium]|nr:endo-1,4-beta-xylanase [Lentisphaeria bacterium]
LEVESRVRGNNWEYQVYLHVNAPIRKGDVLLVHFWARTPYTADESGQSHIKVAIELPGLWKRPRKEKTLLAPLTKSIMLAAGTEWKQFFLRAQAPRDVSVKEFMVALRSGMERQRVQLGALDILNYGQSVKVEDLPLTVPTYAGREPDAHWRQEASARIRQHRMQEMKIVVVDQNGKPLEGVAVKLELKRHAFGFGTAFRASHVLEEFNPGHMVYRERILENFSSASFVNALKWHPWVGDWGKQFDRKVTLEALKWVAGQKLPFRGHCLVWPRKSSVSKAMRKMLEVENPNPEEIQRGILEHINSIGRETAFWMQEWDVLNESIPCHDVQDICGDEVMVEWFKEARKVLPGVKLALNEYSILSSLTDGKKLAQHEQRVKYLLGHGAPVDVLGMQCHMGGTPPSPKRILKVLDRFAKFDLPIRATEFDLKISDKKLAYDFTRDFYTVMFSHPSVLGVQMWGFEQMYDKNSDLTAVGRAHRDLVLDRWHTREKGRTDRNGAFACRAFLGTYTVTLTINGAHIDKTFVLQAGKGPHIETLTP